MDDATQKLVDGLRLDARDYGRKMRGEVPPEELISWDQSNVRAWEAADALEAVTPNLREALIEFFHDRYSESGGCVHGATLRVCVGWADALLASGVLGQPRTDETEPGDE